MACMKCGSAWVTRKSKDMVSCPECCTMQRVKARKQGRLPASEQRNCQRCGGVFEAVGGNALRHARFCGTCLPIAQKERRAKWKADVAAGRRIVARAKTKRPPRKCPVCDMALGPNQRAYCSRRCFGIARKNGTHAWDRTNQLESVWHRGGRWACAPSRKPVQEITTSFQSFLSKVRTLMVRVSRPVNLCRFCGTELGRRSKGFCSVECMQQHEEPMPCRKCGKPATAKAGRKFVTCDDCKRQADSQARKRAKQRYGRNHRQRARRYGVKYVAFPVRSIYERDGYKCQLCGGQVLSKAAYRKRDGKIHPRSPTIDHIVPMSKGGNHEPVNCQTACFSCNTKKGAAAGGQLRLSIG